MSTMLPTVALVLVALLHAIPALGVLGGPWLSRLYGVQPEDADTRVLLRHRAVLFGLLAIGLLAGAVIPGLRAGAIAMGAASMGAFLVLAALEGDVGDATRRVVWADIAGLVVLLIGGLSLLL